ncbi:hypothetical protein ACFQ2T_05095 [Methylophilus flavus]|uniref:Uncharacterized protein n=1 Tax=Methylophilus flavus TaxID=640084 RepID=A0ABW3PCH1_9PROT
MMFDEDNPVTMANCELYKQAHELIQAIEPLGGSPELTAVCTLAAKLMQGIEQQEYKFRHICKEFQSINAPTFMGEPVIKCDYSPFPRRSNAVK